ncbi:MAG: hypothetical protein O6939_09075 [Bacteroidetes bacterium]|nr:hypothetical protein [Bacteroidota bacterium]
MDLKDLIVTPFLILVVYFFAYAIRNMVSDNWTRRYFIPALSLKIVGAILLGVIYQFYYSGGDTFGYFTYGSKFIWDAILDSPINGLKLIFSYNGEHQPETFIYSSKINNFHSSSAYFVTRVSAWFALLTFHTYSATAVLFAVFSFSGLWAMFRTFYNFYPRLHLHFAVAIFFIPSLFFWGSGILKDTLSIGAMGWMVYAFYLMFYRGKYLKGGIIFIVSTYLLYSVKVYILLSLLPCMIVWLYMLFNKRIRPIALRLISLPTTLILFGWLGYWLVLEVGESNEKYNINNLANTAQITAYDIGFWTGRDAGSGYALGELDGTFSSMLKLAPQAINVSLFRPYLWEVKNPLMLLAALESLLMLLITFWVLVKAGLWVLLKQLVSNPVVAFCFVFSIVLAFAVGVSTFNFGTLVRYKIPLIPFYLIGLAIVWYYAKRDKKLSELASLE